MRSKLSAPVEVTLGRDRKAFVNRYTGAVLSEGSSGMRSFFRVVTAWHRTLGASGDRRALGRSITGVANLGFLFIVLSGLFLWWPRTWTRARLRNIALFRRDASAKARDFNWHHTIGVWSFIPLVAITASGVVMSYPWANAFVYRAMGDEPPRQQQPASRGAERRESRSDERRDVGVGAREGAPAASLGIDSALALAAAQMRDWRSISIQLPAPSAKTLTASIDAGTGGQPQLRGSLVIDRSMATISRWEPFASQTPGRRARSILRFAHTGEVLGLTGQTIAGLVSVGALVLAWTGIALALRRFVTWRRRLTRDAEAPRRASRSALDNAA